MTYEDYRESVLALWRVSYGEYHAEEDLLKECFEGNADPYDAVRWLASYPWLRKEPLTLDAYRVAVFRAIRYRHGVQFPAEEAMICEGFQAKPRLPPGMVGRLIRAARREIGL